MAQPFRFPSLNAFVFGDVAAALPGCTTIDRDNNDNGFLGCARGQNPGARLHGSTAEAAAQLLQCLGGGTGRPNIVGHGSDGIIVTGTGDDATNPDQYISLWNQPHWEPHLKQLRGRVSGLSLWACHPGTGNNGADFLFRVAQVINAPAAGPTGFIYCGGGQPDLFLEAGSVWQVATPTHRPNPIDAPTPFFTNLLMDLRLNFNAQIEVIPLGDVISAELIRGKQPNVAPMLSLADDAARGLAQLIRFDAPFQPGGIPAAIITGRLIVTFARNNQQERREFLIYNNRMLQDTSAPDTFYYCLEGFKDALLMLP